MSTTLSDVYLDNDAFAERVPHETFRLLRDEAPVYWYDWEHGKGFWCITRYDDVVAVMKDWRTFSSETGATDGVAVVSSRARESARSPMSTWLKSWVSSPW